MIALSFLLLLSFDRAPVPDGQAIKERVRANWTKSEAALENYSCTVHEQGDELNADGSLRRRKTSVQEQFYVNGIEIEHTLSRDGKQLSGSDAKKEQARVDKEVKKYSDPKEADKSRAKDEKEADMFLRALRFQNGRRDIRDGRSVLVYDLAGDPTFRPKKMEERFAEALTGRISVDEESSVPVEMRFQTIRDVKIAGGLVGSLHKGFWLHIVQQRQPDGVWLTKSVEGSGDARAFFFKARFGFKEQLEKCHLFSVDAKEKIGAPEPKP